MAGRLSRAVTVPCMERGVAMFSRLAGAIIRAMLVTGLVAAPYVALSGTVTGTGDVVVFLALAAAVFTVVEYGAVAPSILEFRDAPPFNRLRFVALFAILATLVTLQHDETGASTLTRLVTVLGARASELIDFPFSPVRLAVLMLPPDATPDLVTDVRNAAGVSYILSLGMLAAFWYCIRVTGWPAREGGFNIWINMPTFDPMAGGDIVVRLKRDGHVNLVLGFLLPFIIPVVVKLVASDSEMVSLTDPQVLIWTMTAWAYLPAILLMRGMALLRIARMVEAQRARNQATDRAFQPA
jgi:hypothetical protein